MNTSLQASHKIQTVIQNYSPKERQYHVIQMLTLATLLPHILCIERYHSLPWHFSSHSTNCSQIKPLSHLVSALSLREIWWPGNKNSNLV